MSCVEKYIKQTWMHTYNINRFATFFSPLGKNMETLVFAVEVLEVVSAALFIRVAAKFRPFTGLCRW
jgi:hypothetical protein